MKNLLRRALRSRGLGLERACVEPVPLPAVNLVNDGLADKLVLANLGQYNSPDNPVQATSKDDTKADYTVNPVWQVLVDILTWGRLDERRNDEVYVAEEEEDGDWKCSFDWRVPVSFFPVEVEIDEAASDKGVDNGERVRDETATVSAGT